MNWLVFDRGLYFTGKTVQGDTLEEAARETIRPETIYMEECILVPADQVYYSRHKFRALTPEEIQERTIFEQGHWSPEASE